MGWLIYLVYRGSDPQTVMRSLVWWSLLACSTIGGVLYVLGLLRAQSTANRRVARRGSQLRPNRSDPDDNARSIEPADER
jgi:hypothetical protein